VEVCVWSPTKGKQDLLDLIYNRAFKVPITLSQILFFLKVDIKYKQKQAAELDLKLFQIFKT